MKDRKNTESRQKNWVIVGASSPIAAELANMLLKNNNHLMMVYSSETSKEESRANSKIHSKRCVKHVSFDVRNPDELSALTNYINQTYDGLDGLIYLAATGGERSKLRDIEDIRIRETFDINVIAAALLLKNTAGNLEKKSGSAVLIGSQAAETGGFNIVPYAASKAALHQMVVASAREYAEFGVRVNCVSPGIIDTPKMRAVNNIQKPEDLEELESKVPLGRLGEPKDVAATIFWLLSKEASYISGCILPVSGAR